MAGILKRLNRKTESYPFDWMVSRLSVVRDVIETDFRFFMDKALYTPKQTYTRHYHEGTNPVPMTICKETIYENAHYQNHAAIKNTITARIPKPLSTENGDTYASIMAFNHRDIRTDETQAYYERCIARFREKFAAPPAGQPLPRVIGSYIHPTITEEEYAEQKEQIHAEFREFYEDVLPQHWSMIYFIMVRTTHPYPITQYKDNVIECVHDENTPTPTPTPERNTNINIRYMKIYVVYTNRDFIDAGEIFMQNAYIETDKMCDLLGGRSPPMTP
jgi:hypothetical protein